MAGFEMRILHIFQEAVICNVNEKRSFELKEI
jgi:hypothetical protein